VKSVALLLACLSLGNGAVAGQEARSRSQLRYERWEARVRPFPTDSFPKLGTCYNTRIRARMPRLIFGDPWKVRDINPDDVNGSAVLFENGLYQVDYSDVPAIVHSRRGDPVRMCVTALPRNCPAGDFRGTTYLTRNLRTGETWQLRDAEHGCGGA
jgi:hypothetical protein